VPRGVPFLSASSGPRHHEDDHADDDHKYVAGADASATVGYGRRRLQMIASLASGITTTITM
jgi:hypothetical protein